MNICRQRKKLFVLIFSDIGCALVSFTLYNMVLQFFFFLNLDILELLNKSIVICTNILLYRYSNLNVLDKKRRSVEPFETKT